MSANVNPSTKNRDADWRSAAVGRRVQHLDNIRWKRRLGEDLLEIVDEMRAAKASNPLDLRSARRFEPDARLVEAEPGGVEESVTAHPVEGGLPQIGARRIGRRIRRPMADDVKDRKSVV